MDDLNLKHVMWMLAVLTPVLGGLVYYTARAAERGGGDAADAAVNRRLKLKCLLLAGSGPVNLAIWVGFNGYLDQIGYRSVIGYVLAAVIFIGGGIATGFFSQRFGRGGKRD